ncbi:aspartate carbamoyltransferase catalytic subunit [Strigomonas culicis]|uniref:aspartate carbamoyltransferase n=1 Tax=Strigomonas culicis TaxID=28005 RepID=S9UJ77_9TRYP|nr:aspartate carbamoyltransferase catalytic subunit [Strigomonas culicis]|eukprot:EPY28809.1 aspartate carbamoyltransferase catalytic subunit [Strigomonas culicis]
MSFTPVASLKGKSVCAASQFDRTDIDALIELARAMKAHIESGQTIHALDGRVMTPLFYEDSSRTLSSFCAAMLRLGGQVVNFKVEGSSVNKGETLEDTVRTLDSYSDVLVLRHPKVEALAQATSVAQHPVMNAGNGSGEHPTQALLDTLTISAELGRVDGITIALIGDLKMGRTVHSLLKLLTHNFSLAKVYLVAPAGLEMPQEVLDAVAADLTQKHIALEQVHALSPAIVADCDVLYATRLQKERFPAAAAGADPVAAFQKAKEDILINKARLESAKEKMIVMHPLPRVDELSTDIDSDPRAAYFRQMKYGLFMRMAILYSVLA